MNNRNHRPFTVGRCALTVCLLAVSVFSVAQEEEPKDQVHLSGSIQSDIIFPQSDSKIGTEDYSEWALTNTFAEVNLTSNHLDAGVRFEYLEHPLPGFTSISPDYAGWGVPYFYVKGHGKNADLTIGTFYEQFGSGFILRNYEERSLGIDNSLLGARAHFTPVKGVALKVLAGVQRRYWGWNESMVAGADMELSLDQWIKPLAEKGTYLTFGASYVTKYESEEEILADRTHKLNLPEYVGAYDLRLRLQTGGWNILAEWAQKGQDPNSNNGYIYRKGYAAMLSTSYSKKGLTFLAQAKRSDNMVYRSRRTLPSAVETSSYINHLPAFTQEHTYALAAHYPYATQPDGEWAYQGEVGYTFKKHTLLGGKYGTKVKLNFSYVNGISKNEHGGMGTDGYGSAFWKWGSTRNYQDLNVQVEKKMSRDFKLNLMYMNQFYNQTVIEGHGEMVHSNIYVAEGKYRINKTFTLRGEAQYLTTGEDQGDWAFGLLELSVQPHLMFTVSDEWNCGKTDIHYYNVSATYTMGGHRLQLGYARTRAGYNCSGGVCRWVPASKGATISYNYNF